MDICSQAAPKGFERVIRHAGRTLLLMDPWDNPRLPTRVWCLYECYTTLAANEVCVFVRPGALS